MIIKFHIKLYNFKSYYIIFNEFINATFIYHVLFICALLMEEFLDPIGLKWRKNEELEMEPDHVLVNKM